MDSIIFKRGQKADCFYLILNGQVSICSGREGFMMDKGIFNYMGEQCITNDDYVPDFSAKVVGKTRLLMITKQAYNESKIKLQNVIWFDLFWFYKFYRSINFKWNKIIFCLKIIINNFSIWL